MSGHGFHAPHAGQSARLRSGAAPQSRHRQHVRHAALGHRLRGRGAARDQGISGAVPRPGGVHVMDTTSYEQHTLDAEATGDHADWLQPEMHIQVEWLNGRPVGIELPSVVELTVVQTSPVMRGATKTASTKPAKLSNGVTIQVPEFVN